MTRPRSAPGIAGSVVVLAKAPLAGRVKTRLCPPLTPAQAAALAAAALADTLAAAAASGADLVLALDGPRGRWCPRGVPVVAQRGAGLAERIGAALVDAHAVHPGPVLLIGMDTPQVSPRLLRGALRRLEGPIGGAVDAVLGDAWDGGWWALGVRAVRPEMVGLLDGVPMSTDRTAAATRARLAEHGVRVADLPVLRDVDTVADAAAVAAQAPGTAFARQLEALSSAAEREGAA